jgi:hypothetical protein
MPSNQLRGDAVDVSQMATHTVGGTPATSQVYTLTSNGKNVTYIALGGDTNTTIAAALVALLNASAIPEIQDATFTSALGVITSVSAIPGVPYTFSTSATGTGTFVTAITQAAAGHEHWGDPTNWTLGRIPAGACLPPVQATPAAVSGGSLTNGTTYYWVVTATNSVGETTKSNQQSLAISTPNLTADLSWAYVPGATGYKVYRSTTTNTYTTPALVATISSGTTVAYADTGTAVATGATPGSNTAAGDDIYLKSTASSVKYDLPTDYLTPNSLHVDASWTGHGGLPDYNAAGYVEYRAKFLMMAPASVYFGENGGVNGGAGSGLFRLDKGSVASTAFEIYQTGNPSVQGQPALYIKGPNSADTYVLQQGFIALAYAAGETAQFATLKSAYLSSPSSDVQLIIGSGCTCGAILQLGGVIQCASNVTTLTMASGSQGAFYLNVSATMGTATLDGGTYYPKTTGAHTAVNVNNGGALDHQQDIRAFNIGTLTLSDGCEFLDPAGTITASTTVVNGNLANMTTNFGTNRANLLSLS